MRLAAADWYQCGQKGLSLPERHIISRPFRLGGNVNGRSSDVEFENSQGRRDVTLEQPIPAGECSGTAGVCDASEYLQASAKCHGTV